MKVLMRLSDPTCVWTLKSDAPSLLVVPNLNQSEASICAFDYSEGNMMLQSLSSLFLNTVYMSKTPKLKTQSVLRGSQWRML